MQQRPQFFAGGVRELGVVFNMFWLGGNHNLNNGSEDEIYMGLITNLRTKLKQLATKIEPKVYEYGFLK